MSAIRASMKQRARVTRVPIGGANPWGGAATSTATVVHDSLPCRIWLRRQQTISSDGKFFPKTYLAARVPLWADIQKFDVLEAGELAIVVQTIVGRRHHQLLELEPYGG